MFNIGEIVHGPHFPESVEIKRCELFGEFYIIEAIGRETNQFYELMLEKEKLTDLKSLKENKSEGNIQAIDIQRYLQYLMLHNEVKYSRTRALGNKKLLPLPHQIEAVYGRMLQVPQIRFYLLMTRVLVKRLCLGC